MLGCVSGATLELAKQQPSLSYTSLISVHESCAFDDEFHATAEREPLQHPAFSKSSSAELQVLTAQTHDCQSTNYPRANTYAGGTTTVARWIAVIEAAGLTLKTYEVDSAAAKLLDGTAWTSSETTVSLQLHACCTGWQTCNPQERSL